MNRAINKILTEWRQIDAGIAFKTTRYYLCEMASYELRVAGCELLF